MEWLILILMILIAYLLGSTPTAYWLGKLFKGVDIREHGSGNVGATNALRVLGKASGVLVLLIDVGKGILAVRGIPRLFPGLSPLDDFWTIALLGLTAALGHIWTVFLKFQGGKGVATSFGVFLGLDPLIAAIALLVWIVLLLMFRYVSVSSMAAAITLPIVMAVWARPFPWVLISAILCIIICYRHRSNVQRLLLGTEKKIGT